MSPTREELARTALILARQFINRWDMYPKQLQDGSYVTMHERLTAGHLTAHLAGELTLGTYLLNPDSRGRFVVLDADDEAAWEQLGTMAADLAAQRTLGYLEQSRRGGHLWLFLKTSRPGPDIRRFAQGLLAAHRIEDVEIYPKQEVLTTGPGSLIRLPFGVHQKSGKRYGFFAPTGERLGRTVRDQIRHFVRPQTVPETVFEQYQDAFIAEASVSRSEASEGFTPLEELPADAPLSERLKASITVKDFVGQYVELSTRGTGVCPFHDDHHDSFSVHEGGNFWNCFACGTGGSIIDFWMQYKSVDFSEAVKELAQMLL